MLQVIAARDAVVAFDGIDDVAQAQPQRPELLRIDNHLVLLDETAKAVDFGHAGYRTELRRDDPVLNFAQLGERIAIASHHILVDLAERRRDGSQLRRRDVGGELVPYILQTLGHELSGKVNVGAFFEFDRDGRQTELADRAHFFDPR